MAEIHNEYPHGLKDKDIENSIKEYALEISAARGNINTTMVFTPLIQLGQSELQSRQTKRATILTVIVSFTSLLISGAALYVAYNATDASTIWEDSQLRVLKKISSDINSINPEIINSLSEYLNRSVENTNKSTQILVDTIKRGREAVANKALNSQAKPAGVRKSAAH